MSITSYTELLAAKGQHLITNRSKVAPHIEVCAVILSEPTGAP